MLISIVLVISIVAMAFQAFAIWSQRQVIKSYRLAHETWKELCEDRFQQINQLKKMVDSKTRDQAILQGQFDESQSKLRDIAQVGAPVLPESFTKDFAMQLLEPGIKIRTILQIGEEYSFPGGQVAILMHWNEVDTTPLQQDLKESEIHCVFCVSGGFENYKTGQVLICDSSKSGPFDRGRLVRFVRQISPKLMLVKGWANDQEFGVAIDCWRPATKEEIAKADSVGETLP